MQATNEPCTRARDELRTFLVRLVQGNSEV